MMEMISHLTKMRFGEQEHNKAKDTKEVSNGDARDVAVLLPAHVRPSVSACRGHLLQAGGAV